MHIYKVFILYLNIFELNMNTRGNYAKLFRNYYPNSQVKMAELRECESSQDKKLQGTCIEGSVCTSDVIISDIVQVRDIRHLPLESKQHGKTLAYQE